VEVIVQADIYGVQVVALQQVPVVRIHVGNLEPGCDSLREGFVDVCHGYDLRAGDLSINLEMLLAALSCADHANTNRSLF
jgi:hypothetical protein